MRLVEQSLAHERRTFRMELLFIITGAPIRSDTHVAF